MIYIETKRQILGCISDWWNDTLRKCWRTALEDPEEREKLFNELANLIHEKVSLGTESEENIDKVDGWLLKNGEEWLRKVLRPHRLIEWERLSDYGQYPTEESLFKLADGMVLAWRRGEISHDDAVRRFFAALMENKYGSQALGIERIEVRGENIMVWAYHTLGWSGNESIIDALECPPNDIFFYRYLERYDASGHYYFKIPDFLLPKEILEGGDREEIRHG